MAILTGGHGSRLAELTETRPKPLAEIGGRPLLLHIMDCYAAAGFTEFVIALGYRGDMIKDYFLSYRRRSASLSIDLRLGTVTETNVQAEDWMVHLLDTGLATNTGGRVRRVAQFIGDETFMLTYGDAVASIDPAQLLAFHRSHGRSATVTAVRPPPTRFGKLALSDDVVTSYEERDRLNERWINGGFFVLEPSIQDYIDGDETVFDREPIRRLIDDQQLMAFRFHGFWQCMDTLWEMRLLQELWETGQPPWIVSKPLA